MQSQSQSSAASSNTLNLVLSWALVGIPLAWGIYNTVKNALKLFA